MNEKPTYNLATLRTPGALQDWETGEVETDPKIIADHERRVQREWRRKEALDAAKEILDRAIERYHRALCSIEKKYGG